MRKISFVLLTLALFLASPAMGQPAPSGTSDATVAKTTADAGTTAPADTADKNEGAQGNKTNEKSAQGTEGDKANAKAEAPTDGKKPEAKAAEEKKPAKFEWKTSGMIKVADEFVAAIANKQYDKAYAMGGEVLRKERTLEAFIADTKKWGFDKPGSVKWDKGNNALPVNNGFKLMGTFTGEDKSEISVYMHLEGDAHVSAKERNRKWTEATKWTVMDYRSSESMFKRLGNGTSTILDKLLLACLIGLLIALIGLTWGYIKGLKGHPR